MAEREELKSLLKKVKEESGKASLKHQKTKIMASGSITSWHIDGGKKNGNSGRLNFLGLQNHCGWCLQP